MSAPNGNSCHSGTSRVAATVVWFANSSSQFAVPTALTTFASSDRSRQAWRAALMKRSASLITYVPLRRRVYRRTRRDIGEEVRAWSRR